MVNSGKRLATALPIVCVVWACGSCSSDSTTSSRSIASHASSVLNPVPGAAPATARIGDSDTRSLDSELLHASGTSLLNDILLAGYSFDGIQFHISQAISECMAALGWSYFPPSAPADDHAANFQTILTLRATDGYGLATSTLSPATPDANIAYMDSLAPAAQIAYVRALEGSATDGSGYAPADDEACAASARVSVTKDIPFFQPEYADLQKIFISTMETDAAFVAATNAWVACMMSHGYLYSTFAGPRSDLIVQLRTLDRNDIGAIAAFRAKEISVATVDSRCYEEFVLPVRVPLEQEIVQDLFDSGRLPYSEVPDP